MGAANLIFLVLLLGLFYLLLIRPQKRRLRQHEDLVSSLAPGDEIVTIGGIIGYVKGLEDEYINVEISDGCVIRVVKQAIGRKVERPNPALEQTAPETVGPLGVEGTSGTDDTE
ncbi:MAG TPA: preprotein translocase subunit YajC [Actinomycetota bacterium]|nr:preprotein translocase subunit YajC [Actinomycetota bacterium]